MSQRFIIAPNALDAIDMSQSSSHSEVTIIKNPTLFSYEVSWSGSTPTGTLIMEISNSYALEADGSVANAGNWTQVPMDVNGAYATSIAISGNSGVGFIEGELSAGYAVRLTYTRSGGSGTMNLIFAGKVA